MKYKTLNIVQKNGMLSKKRELTSFDEVLDVNNLYNKSHVNTINYHKITAKGIEEVKDIC